MIFGHCTARADDGGDTDHCTHAVPDEENIEVCCWCGDLFRDDEAFEHGVYHPNPPPVPLGAKLVQYENPPLRKIPEYRDEDADPP